MPWMLPAAVVGSSIGGALIGSNSASKAAKEQAAATRAAVAENTRQFDMARADQAPFRETGGAALQRLRMMIGLPGAVDESDPRYRALYDQLAQAADAEQRQATGHSIYEDWHTPAAMRAKWEANVRDATHKRFVEQYGEPSKTDPMGGSLERKFSVEDFWQDPVVKLGYDAGLEEGRKALGARAPLTTGRDSGAAIKELTKFATDYSGQKAGESQARFEGEKSNVFNRLMALIGGGQVANQVSAAAGSNMATNNANLITSGANAQGAARIAQGNAWTGALGNISNWWQNQQNNAQQERMWDRYIGMRTNGGFAL